MASRTISLTAPQVLLVAVSGAAAPRVLRWTCSLLSFAWRHLLRRSNNLSKYGEWAVVTGATDGIGRSYCDRFAEKGLYVLLVSRNTEKLKSAASEIQSQHGVQCKWHAIDLVEAAASRSDADMWNGLKAQVDDLDVGVLVNNAGACYSYPEMLSELDASTVHDVPALNVSSLAKVTRLVLPGMMERQRGAIINLSSIAAARIADGSPLLALYSGTKAFVENFSASLAAECRPAGIHVQVHSPAFVNTKMFVQPNDATSVSADTFTREAVRRIGFERRAVPCAQHAMLEAITKSLPGPIFEPLMWDSVSKLRAQALQEMRDGTRVPSGTLAGAVSLPEAKSEAIVRMESRQGGART